MLFIIFLACGQPEPEPTYVPPPPLIIKGRNIKETLPDDGDYVIEMEKCPVEDIKRSLGWPRDYYDDGGLGWDEIDPKEWFLQALPHPEYPYGCYIKVGSYE